MPLPDHERQLLAYLLGKGTRTVDTIAKELGWGKEEVSQLAARLASEGRVITKEKSGGMTVVITDAGVAKLTS
jgi:Mn-dependent DtxR family transcriptional regulator